MNEMLKWGSRLTSSFLLLTQNPYLIERFALEVVIFEIPPNIAVELIYIMQLADFSVIA